MDGTRTLLLLLLIAANGVAGILPDFGFGDEGAELSYGIGSENLPVFEDVRPRVSLNVNASRVVKSPQDALSIEDLSKRLQTRNGPERSLGAVPAKSIKELEELMQHPTWLTETRNRNNDLASKTRRIFVVPASAEHRHLKNLHEEQKEHIRDIITKFHTLKPKDPITDNRITKFVFTHDTDLATSKTVQEHNREVAAAFKDFNRKLEETLNVKPKKIECDKNEDREMLDRSFNKIVSFLDRNIQKLKEENAKQVKVCKKRKVHADPLLKKEVEGTKKMSDVRDSPLRRANMRFHEMAQTRDGLENILLGLDRPRTGPYKRHVSVKFGRTHSAKSLPKKHN